MRSRVFIITATALTLLLALVGGVYLYDRGARDVIPEGVSVAGVDVGGMDAGEARAALEREYLPRLREDVRVHHGEKTFVLTPEQSAVAADVEGAVRAAVDKARDGNMFTRSFRRLTGGELDEDVEPQVTFDKAAVVRYLDGIRGSVDRDPIDAEVRFTSDGMQVVEGRDGLEVKASELHQQIRAAVVDPEADHRLVAYTEHTSPAVSTDDVKKKFETALLVDRSSFTLKLYKDLKLVETYTVGIGAAGVETPAGLYNIQNKAVNPAWTKPYSDWVPAAEQGQVVPGGIPENPLKARWMGIFDGAGIHGIDPSLYGTLGTAASHGCVRMRIEDVIELYDQVPVGAPIYIA